MQSLQQGDVLVNVTHMPVQDMEGLGQIATPDGAVIISQTCDVIRDSLYYLHVAPLKQLSDNDARQAQRGRRPRYVHLPGIGDHEFVDLANIGSLHKAVAAQSNSFRGVNSDEEISKFGKAIGRHFNRFAYPDEVSEFLSPLADSIQSRSGKLESPEGRHIENVLQLRIESINGWSRPPYDLRLIIVTCPGVLPTFPNDELPTFEEGLQNWLYNSDGMIQRSPHEITEKLEHETNSAARYYLWSALGDAWASRCRTSSPSVALTAEVVSADEFSLTRMLQSELVDLDHLSKPDGQPV
jgi:hypothetical protein